MTTTTTAIESVRLADQLERSFRGGAWHGPSLAEAIAGIEPEVASQRPSPNAHTILELVAHVAYWLAESRRRLPGADSSVPAAGEDWAPSRGNPADAWRAAVAELEDAHRRLHAAVLALDDESLDAATTGSDSTVRGTLLGLLQHNAYHGGQIALLRKLAGSGAGGER